MVDPKKEYELLMRYLQGGAVKQEPADPPYAEERKPTPQPITATEPAPATTTVTPLPSNRRRKTAISWPRRKPVSLRRSARILSAVLSGVFLLALLWNGYYLYQLSPDAIFNKLYVPFKTIIANQALPAAKTGIEQYYAAGNFVAATLQSKKQPRLSDREQLLTGLAWLHRDDYTKAIKWLEPLSNNFESPYRQQAEYYLALTYLKNEDYDRSIQTLEHIRLTPAHPYQNNISESTISDIKMLKWK